VVIILVSMVFNMLIACKVLPKLRKNLGCGSITFCAHFMLIVFEVIMLFRLLIIPTQDYFKEKKQEAWKNTMIVYFSCCEMVLYVFLITEIIHQACAISGLTAKIKLSLQGSSIGQHLTRSTAHGNINADPFRQLDGPRKKRTTDYYDE